MNEDFSQFLRDKIRKHNLSLRRLSELSGIPVGHLESMLRDEWEELPPAPYLRGYLQHLGKILDFDAEAWWLQFKKMEELRASGGYDRLPQNRYALRPARKYGWVIVVVAVILIYFGLRFTKIFGQPILTIEQPAAAIVRVSTSSLTLSGRIEGGDQVLVNAETVSLAADGSFQKNIVLQPGLNTIQITAKKFLGGETKILRQIIYEPATSTAASTP